MAMHIDAAPRLPTRLVAALVVIGVALGLWQVGVFDRSNSRGSGASASANAVQSRNPARAAAADEAAGEVASPINRAKGGEAERPATAIERLASEPDPEVHEETGAWQEALAAEQASN